LIIGDATVIEKAAREAVKRQDIAIHPVSSVNECFFTPETIDVHDLRNVEIEKLKIGKVDAMSGSAAFTSVKKAIEFALTGEIDAVVTNALNKEALNLAGYRYAGHTEIFADLTGTKDYSMMLAEGNLRIAHISTHVPLREACGQVKKDRVLKVIRMAHNACKRIGISEPRVAVAGLNPHAGEGGLFGREEIEEIIPAIEAAVAEGINADGPIPPDTVFAKARGGLYDIVTAMYHDQGHIPLKLLGFQYDSETGTLKNVNGVNITLGLPIIRTSVDHGTAFDCAWDGSANESSLVSAIEYGVRLS
jgi:4-hydroxythreonine-4-phosphate dehydrogenase